MAVFTFGFGTRTVTELKDRDGIDVLHHGHRYSILPPSLHPETGQPYTWVHDPTTPMADLPEWLADALTPAPVAQAATKAPTIASNNAYHDDGPSPAEWYNDNASWSEILTGWRLVPATAKTTAPNGPTQRQRPHFPQRSVTNACLCTHQPQGLPVTETNDPNGLTKFRAEALLNYGGDMAECARDIRRLMPDPITGEIPTTPQPLIVPDAVTTAAGTSPVLKVPGNYTNEFWETTPLLAQIRQAAWASYDAPAATLAALLARATAAIPPSVRAVVIDPASGNTFKSPDSLNLIIGTVATSGGGKSSSVKAAERLLPYERRGDRRLVDWERSDLQLGSGQGIDATYLEQVKDPEDAKKTITKVVDNPKALFTADEGEIYDELTGGGGSTLKSTLRKAAFGETLGAANAGIDTRRHVGAHQYRLAMILCFQVATAKAITADHLGGDPAAHRHVRGNTQGPAQPGPHRPRRNLRHLGTATGNKYSDPDRAPRESGPSNHRRIPRRLLTTPGRYGSHRRRNQSKLAVVLQLLHDPTARTVDPMFWDLAETIVDGSDSVYGLIDAAAAHDPSPDHRGGGP